MSKIAVIQLVNISNIERDIPESKSDNYEVQKESSSPFELDEH